VNWLNANSGAIQALGSVASVVITGVLAFITWKYVRLTDKLLGEQSVGPAGRNGREEPVGFAQDKTDGSTSTRLSLSR